MPPPHYRRGLADEERKVNRDGLLIILTDVKQIVSNDRFNLDTSPWHFMKEVLFYYFSVKNDSEKMKTLLDEDDRWRMLRTHLTPITKLMLTLDFFYKKHISDVTFECSSIFVDCI